MFITLVHKNRKLAAKVKYTEQQVIIKTDDDALKTLLATVYSTEMKVEDFARANYRLDRYRSAGLLWELVLASEYEE